MKISTFPQRTAYLDFHTGLAIPDVELMNKADT